MRFSDANISAAVTAELVADDGTTGELDTGIVHVADDLSHVTASDAHFTGRRNEDGVVDPAFPASEVINAFGDDTIGVVRDRSAVTVVFHT